MKIKKNRSPIGKIVIMLVTIFLIGGIVGLYWKNKTKDQSIGIPKIPMTIKTINEETKLYAIKADYPVFENNLDVLNKKIEKDVTSRIDDFKKQAAENWADRKKFSPGEVGEFPDNPFAFALNYSPQEISKNFISFVMDISWYTGGANMAQDDMTVNWDVKKNKPVVLSDLFPSDPNHLETISQYVRDDLKKQFLANGTEEKYIAVDMLNEGTAPKEDNFSRFTFDDKIITFYFPKYQVAPGAFGPQRVIMFRNAQ